MAKPPGKFLTAQPEEPRIVEPEAVPFQVAPDASVESPPGERPFNPDMDAAPRDGTLLEVEMEDGSHRLAQWRTSRRRENRLWVTFGHWIVPGSMPAADIGSAPVAWRVLEGYEMPGMLRGAA